MADSRALAGQQNVGMPLMKTFGAVIDAVDAQGWEDFHREPVGRYFDLMFGQWVPRLLDRALDDEKLQSLDPLEVRVLTFVLLRDLFRHNHAILRPQQPDADWVEPLFENLADQLGIPAERLVYGVEPFELDDMSKRQWAEALAAPFGIMPQKLFAAHSACVTGAVEAPKKPWWRFW
jgi:hypothetical protein